MLNSVIVRTVDFCTRHRWLVITGGFVLAIAAAAYDVTRFSITTDIDALISQKLPWHQRQIALSKAFPQQGIAAVVTAQTPENAEKATNLLAQELAKNPDLFGTIEQPDSGDFFEREGLLFQPLPELRKSVDGLAQAQPLIAALAYDPSLRGVMKTLSYAADGVTGGQVKLDQLVWPLSLAEKSLNAALSGAPAAFSWREMVQGHSSQISQLRHFIQIDPVLDFGALQPGRKATEAIRRAAADLKRDQDPGAQDPGAKVELTGPVPMNDDQFSVIRESAPRDTFTALIGVLIILWLALRSWRIIAAVVFGLMVGLAVTAALGLAMVGSFNLISVAFFVLFVGLGVDFGIQFSVRYRSERHACGDLDLALRSAAQKAGTPLALAAATTAVGFFAFLPTNYTGLSELGLIAGCGMLIAFLCSITLVPAMLAALDPPGEPTAIGFRSLAPIDAFLQRHRIPIIAGTIIVVLAGTPLLLHLPFDFNPINLQNPAAPSVVTYRELQKSPETNATDAEIIAPSLDKANDIAKRLAALPQVSRVLTVSSFIPGNQDEKIAAIETAQQKLEKALASPQKLAPPSDQDNVAAIRAAAAALSKAAGNATDSSAEAAKRVSDLLLRLADSDAATRARAEAATVPPLLEDLDQLQRSLNPTPITIQSLPSALSRAWLLPDGRARVQALPKGDTDNDEVLQAFATAVLRAEPLATGPAITYYEAGKTITGAFIESGVLALAAIAVLLSIALRRLTDVLLAMVPLLIAGAVTLEICVLSHFSLNFANIIALPLLLGVGVAFKIYYVMAWRAGKTGLLQSALTRAVIFSAMTNAAAFGSMWSSGYPGMSSMGKLMFLALLCTMAAAVFFQPVLMGRPRQIESHAAADRLPEAAE
jgi:hopanoid biosynthesis associated RND transporter like protein HpnN